MKRVYRSKIDSWILAILVVAMGVCLYASYQAFNGEEGAFWPVMLTLLVGVGLPLWLVVDTRYVIETQRLLIRCGPFRWKVPLRDITSMEPSRNPLSSPALSLDRIRIEYGTGRSIMISPRDKQKFIEAVEAQRSQLR